MVGTTRFYHVYHFNAILGDPSELDPFESQFQSPSSIVFNSTFLGIP
jgi:hypothetical protein